MKTVPASAFAAQIVLDPSDPVRRVDGPGGPRYKLVSLARRDYSGAEEPTEAFAAALKDALLAAAKWLAKQPPKAFQPCVRRVT